MPRPANRGWACASPNAGTSNRPPSWMTLVRGPRAHSRSAALPMPTTRPPRMATVSRGPRRSTPGHTRPPVNMTSARCSMSMSPSLGMPWGRHRPAGHDRRPWVVWDTRPGATARHARRRDGQDVSGDARAGRGCCWRRAHDRGPHRLRERPGPGDVPSGHHAGTQRDGAQSLSGHGLVRLLPHLRYVRPAHRAVADPRAGTGPGHLVGDPG